MGILVFREWEERGTEESQKSGEHTVAIINCMILSGQK